MDSLAAIYLSEETKSLKDFFTEKKVYYPCIILIILWITPFIFLKVMGKYEKELKFIWIKRKIGTLYLGLNPDQGPVKWHAFTFLIRRTCFVAIYYFLISYPFLQICSFMVLSLAFLIYINQFSYFDESISQKLENFNEFLLLLICYILTLFCNLLDAEEI